MAAAAGTAAEGQWQQLHAARQWWRFVKQQHCQQGPAAWRKHHSVAAADGCGPDTTSAAHHTRSHKSCGSAAAKTADAAGEWHSNWQLRP
jgi:hypothetical protein